MSFRPRALAALALSVCPFAAAQSAPSPAFQIQAFSPATGGPGGIALTGFKPGSEVRLTAQRLVYSSFHGGKGLLFRSEARFKADASGALDLAKAAPLSGTYSGADLRGLFWSMAATDGPVPAGMAPGQVRLRAEAEGQTQAEATILFRGPSKEVIVEPVPAFPGAVFAALPGAAKRPAIIVLGGADGGSGAARKEAPLLATQGFAVLGLPYYSPTQAPGGPREIPQLPADFADIPVDRLQAAYAWLKTRPGVDADRIALYGASKGAEFALLGAVNFPWVKAAALISPSDVVWEGWGFGIRPGTRSSFSLDGKPLPFVPYEGFVEELMGLRTGADIHLRRPDDRGRAAHPAAAVAARIPAERFRGALMVVAGEDDQMWNAGMMAQNIAERRAEAGLPTETLIFPDAGHYLNGDGWSPTTHYNAGQVKSGGTPAATARAQAAVAPRLIAFLKAALKLE